MNEKRDPHIVAHILIVVWVVAVCVLALTVGQYTAVIFVSISLLVAGAARAFVPNAGIPYVRNRVLDSVFLIGAGVLFWLLAPWANMPMLS